MRMIVFEDAGVGRLGPLAQTRPVFELRCGVTSLIERQRRCLDADEAGALVRPEVAALCRWAWPELAVNDPDWSQREPVVLVNGRWLAPPSIAGLDTPHVGLVGDQIAYAVLPSADSSELSPQSLSRTLAALRQVLPSRAVGGVMINYPWDLVENNARALLEDESYWRTNREAARFAGLTIQGPAERFLADGSARIEPFVLIDTTKGPVMLDQGVIVSAFSRLEGPCYVGRDTQVMAGRIKGSSFGPQCRIGGEVESSIVYGHSNKAHEGFLGHSYLGEWVNLGAGTQTSDLRNDYGQVTMVMNGERVASGLIKIGSFIGDHTKTSIDTLFNTGSTAGPFAMLLTAGKLMPRTIPAFSLINEGRLRERTDLGAMFATAKTMMSRRQVEWTSDHEDFFFDLYERTSKERQRLVSDTEQRLRRVV